MGQERRVPPTRDVEVQRVPPPALEALAPPAPVTEPAAGPETIEVRRFAELGGIELWTVRNSARLWSVYHTTYSVCCPTPDDRPHPENRWRYRKRTYSLGPQSTALMEPGETHSTLSLERPVSFEVLMIDAEALARAQEESGHPVRQVRLREAQLEDPAAFRRFQRLCETLRDPLADPLEREARLRACVRAMFPMEAWAADEGAPITSAAVDRARAYIEEHFAASISLTDIATAAGVSKFHLERAFNAIHGVAVWEYVRRVRVARAMVMLRTGSRAGTVASLTGFSDQAHMTRVFRELLGFTPGAYARARNRA